MILKKYTSLFFSAVIFCISLNLSVTKGQAEENKFTATCQVNNTNINCYNLQSNETFNINLFNEPYRIQIDFKKKLIIKKNKIYKSKFVKNIRSNKFSKSNTKLVIEFKKPTIISDIKYFKVNDQHFNISMFYSNTSVTNYAIAKHVLSKNNGDIFSLGNEINISSANSNKKPEKVESSIIGIPFSDV